MSNEQLTDEQIKQKLESELGPEIERMSQEVLEPSVSSTPVVNWYEFDWDNKVNSLEDIKVIFKSLRMTVSNKAEEFDVLKKYVKDEVAYTTN